MQVSYTVEVALFVEKLSLQDHARLDRIRKLFENYGFLIGQKYIKKVTRSGIWELRSGNVRIFLCIKGEKAIGVHAIYKKSQKLLLRDLKLTEKRCKNL